jgi:hypothetical protein
MAVKSGVRIASTDAHIGVAHVRNTTHKAHAMSMTEVNTGVLVAWMMLTSVTIAMNTMQTVAIDAQRTCTMVSVLSTTIPTDLMPYSIAPTRMSACTLG